MVQFEANKKYGNDLTIKVLKRTNKTLTIETQAFGVQRVKIREFVKGYESIIFKAWSIDASETYNVEESINNFYDNINK